MVDAVSTWELNDALSHDDREVRRTNHGVVTQIDDDGQIWVRLAGADEDTPIAQTTVSVDAGDSVTVRIQDGRAYIDGSTSNPSASSSGLANVDGKAIQALTDAATAAQAALEAVADAATARQAATEAVESAETAQDAAEAAQGSADYAREAADKAIFSLTDLENVVGTVNWIAEHGEYVLTEDTAIVDGKPYYTRSGTSPDYIYTVVAEPVASELSTYYELHLDESVQNFLASHIWLDQYGLNIAVSNTNAYRIHQGTVDGTKTMGMYVIDASGNIVADFTASSSQIGKSSSGHVVITPSNLTFKYGPNSTDKAISLGGTTSGSSIVFGRETPAIDTLLNGQFLLYNENSMFGMERNGASYPGFWFGQNYTNRTIRILANGYISADGNISAGGNLEVGGNVDADGNVVADGTIRSNDIISVRDSSIDRDASTIAEDDWATSYFRCQDKDGDVIAVLRNAQRTNGRMDTFLYVYNDDETGESYTDNYIRISVARDGTRTYAVGDPSAFRNALGINTWGFATGASDTTLSNSETKVSFTSITASGCTLSSGGIKVNATGNYEISGSYEFRTGFNANDICHIIVKNGTTVIAHALWRTYSANPYYTMTLPPFVVSLSANDVIYMYVYNQGGARGIGRATATQGNGLYVKRLN